MSFCVFFVVYLVRRPLTAADFITSSWYRIFDITWSITATMLLTYCHLPYNRLLLTSLSFSSFCCFFVGSLSKDCGSRFLSFFSTGSWRQSSVSLGVCICIETLKNPLLHTMMLCLFHDCVAQTINHSNTNTTVNHSTMLLCEALLMTCCL